MVKDSLEAELKEPIILEYAKAEKPKRKWYNPLKYKGAMISLGYSAIWPGITCAYVYGFDCIYDKYFPSGSFKITSFIMHLKCHLNLF